MADDPVAPPSNTAPGPIPFNQFSAEDQKILHPNKTIEETSPPRVLPWSKNLGSLDADKIASARQRWVDAKLDPAVFDAAAAADGHAVPDFDDLKLQKEHGLNNATAREIVFETPAAQKHNSELIGFVSAMKMQPGLASALVDWIANNGPGVSQMSAAEQANWIAKEEKLGITLCAGKANWEKAKVDAKAMLARLKDVPDASGGRFARDLNAAALLNSAFLTTTLATQHQYWTSYAAAAARKAKAGKK